MHCITCSRVLRADTQKDSIIIIIISLLLVSLSKLECAKASLNRARVALHRVRKEKENPSSTLIDTHVLESKQPTCTCSLCEDLNCLPESQRQFFQSQIRACKYSKFGMRFTVQDKLLALGLYYKRREDYD